MVVEKQGFMQDTSLIIQEFNNDNSAKFWEMLESFSFHVDIDYYERCIERHKNGELIIITASTESKNIGYCFLNWQPKYAYFKKCSIPEIQDLNVLSQYRRGGVGGALIKHCEKLCANHKEIGIGVGMDASFGAAQRLYIRMGYIPDGAGLCYDRKPVAKGEFKPIDENLSLMMTKMLI